ncbi:SDR family NAD(P)-dependent oxidoreductase [Panacagrimonas sp.]|uniref:SDR family NAD(P)-dependent oxidoreductase n=1 Tax=Panacagrimonas sp. TaxID=2480088 RepID=UPI003B52B279
MKALFQDKTVLITGAAAGIGRAMALGAAEEGARLVLGDVDAQALNATVAELRGRGATVYAATCDVRRQADLDALVADGEREAGPLDTVFANAGVLGSPSEVWKIPEAQFAAVMDINVMGCWRTLRAVLPGMVERRRGTLVATASAGGLIGAPGLSAYVASKHAVVGLVRTTALEVAAHGIRVNALCPGMTDTAMLDRVANEIPGLRESLMSMNPSGRVGRPDEVARAALWLGSAQSTFVTGHPLVIDGGFLAQ